MSRQQILSLFPNKTSHEHQAATIMLFRGRINNFEFQFFTPNCLSHTKVIHRIKVKLETCTAYTVKTYREGKTNKYFWKIERKTTDE